MSTIIVVEDDELFLDIHKKHLSIMGHKALLANCADEALILLRDNKNTDLIITDIKMPGKNGIELIEELGGTHPELPIIACSGILSVKEEITFFHGERNVVFIEKPIDMELLDREINRLLEIKKNLDASS